MAENVCFCSAIQPMTVFNAENIRNQFWWFGEHVWQNIRSIFFNCILCTTCHDVSTHVSTLSTKVPGMMTSLIFKTIP